MAQTNVNESAAEPAVEQAATTPEPPPMKYAWQGWNDPAYQRETIQNSAGQFTEIAGHAGGADRGGADHAADAQEGATSPAYTTGSGRSVPDRVKTDARGYGVDSATGENAPPQASQASHAA